MQGVTRYRQTCTHTLTGEIAATSVLAFVRRQGRGRRVILEPLAKGPPITSTVSSANAGEDAQSMAGEEHTEPTSATTKKGNIEDWV